jgi:hypothetical protein
VCKYLDLYHHELFRCTNLYELAIMPVRCNGRKYFLARLALAVVCPDCAITPLPQLLYLVAPTTSQPCLLAYTLLELHYRLFDLTFSSHVISPIVYMSPDLNNCHPHLPSLIVIIPDQCHHSCLSSLTIALSAILSSLAFVYHNCAVTPLPSHVSNVLVLLVDSCWASLT